MQQLNGKKLAQMRHSRGLTQNDIAMRLEISPRSYQRWEHGTTKITSQKTIQSIADVLGVPTRNITDNIDIDPQQVQDEIDDLVNTVLEKFGPSHQAIILIEEMSELTKVLCKIQRGKFERGKLNEEFSHVQISCEVIRRIMQIQHEDVSEQVRTKLQEYAQI